jgi:hypothetical protein
MFKAIAEMLFGKKSDTTVKEIPYKVEAKTEAVKEAVPEIPSAPVVEAAPAKPTEKKKTTKKTIAKKSKKTVV